ncbi:MAG: hypothetical protein CMK59_04220, partial [Proteobacteria bacterium]|nr:hypothetical protein [Pseudomonadota bacterium]
MRYTTLTLLLGCEVGIGSSYLDEKENDSAVEDTAVETAELEELSPEICNDGIDNDEDELIDCSDPDCGSAQECLVDNDNDGFFATNDCDDNNPSIYPGAPE